MCLHRIALCFDVLGSVMLCCYIISELKLLVLSVTSSHLHFFLNREGRLGTTDDFTASFLHFSMSSIFLCSPELSILWYCLPTSSSACLIFFPLLACLARWFWPDLKTRLSGGPGQVRSGLALCCLHLHLHLSLNHAGRLGTKDELTTCFLYFFLFSTAHRDLASYRPIHSLMLSSHLSFCLPCLLPNFT